MKIFWGFCRSQECWKCRFHGCYKRNAPRVLLETTPEYIYLEGGNGGYKRRTSEQIWIENVKGRLTSNLRCKRSNLQPICKENKKLHINFQHACTSLFAKIRHTGLGIQHSCAGLGQKYAFLCLSHKG